MRFSTLSVAAATCALARVANAAHGDDAEGSFMGPVSFLWPEDRNWNAAFDNKGPCGSADGVVNRTQFPISAGSVALSIADEAYKVAFYIAFGNDPVRQSEFNEQVVDNVTEVAPGHQCYKIDDIPSSVTAGSNATIQLQYWAVYEGENNNQNETFYACADITFVNDVDFKGAIPCFNVTASEFDSDGPSSTAAAGTTATATPAATGTAAAAATTTAASAATEHKSSSGLSAGAKAGIAVGSIIGGIAIGVLAVFVYLRKRRTGYLERRRASKVNAPIPLNKRSADGTSLTSV